jgi:hypothetical protein
VPRRTTDHSQARLVGAMTQQNDTVLQITRNMTDNKTRHTMRHAQHH